MRSPPVSKLDMGERELKREFDDWKSDREREAKDAFGEMLKENSFVEFWGRFGKMAKRGDLDEPESLEDSKDATTGSLGDVKFDDEGLERTKVKVEGAARTSKLSRRVSIFGRLSEY